MFSAGSPTSQTTSAANQVTFSRSVASTSGFTGTVNLSCAITPVVSPAPTCTLSNSSVQLSGGTSQSVTVTVGTTSASASVPPYSGFPTKELPPLLAAALLTAGLLLVPKPRRWFAAALPIAMLSFAVLAGCGGNSSSSSSSKPGTPHGTYTATVTATSGTLSHPTALTVVVQ